MNINNPSVLKIRLAMAACLAFTERDIEAKREVLVVPKFDPTTIAIAPVSPSNPCEDKMIASPTVTELDCTKAVIIAPATIPMAILSAFPSHTKNSGLFITQRFECCAYLLQTKKYQTQIKN